jgi:23S rRNA pseudouridine955/2504/2580 synthase
MELKTGADDADRRLDRILRKALPDHPLSLLHRLLRQGRVLVDGRPAAPGDRVAAGAVITIPDISLGAAAKPRALHFPGPAPDILWQSAGILVLNKPPGIAVHGPGGLDGQVRAYLAESLSDSLSFRPGPLHRLDKPTSGLIVFSTSLEGARYVSALFREQHLRKSYLALVEGRVEQEQVWQDELVRDRDAKKTFAAHGGKAALTRARPLAVSETGYTLLLAEIETGRTHQIRAQAAVHGHPLAGDSKYGGRAIHRGGGFFLHAWKLELRETAPGPEKIPPLPRSVTAPPPAAFLERIHRLFGTQDWLA